MIFGIIFLFTVPLVLSLLMTVMGAVLIVRARKKERTRGRPVDQHFKAGSIFLFFLALQMMNEFDKIIG